MGRRSLPDRTRGNWRVGSLTPDKLNEIALMLGFSHGEGGAVGKMLDAIAAGDYLVIPKDVLKKRAKNG